MKTRVGQGSMGIEVPPSRWYTVLMQNLGSHIRYALDHNFTIQTTVTKHDGSTRTVETTYVWDGQNHVCLSGYPGRRDWVASMAAHAEVTVHILVMAQKPGWYDIRANAEVLRARDRRVPLLLAFVERWTNHGGAVLLPLRLILAAINLNRKLRLPWWGPFFLVRRLLDQMPCVELTFAGDPVARHSSLEN